MSSNEIALSYIVPPLTIKRYRRIAVIRLLKMQAELSSPAESICTPVIDEVDVRRAA